MSGWRYRVALAAPLLLALAACGDVAARRDPAADVATRLLTAVAADDGATACGLLAPDTVAELEKTAGRPCAAAILAQQLPAPSPVRVEDVYGQQARVVLATDTLFLAAFQTGWRVIAAGCKPQPDQPYDCTVQGG